MRPKSPLQLPQLPTELWILILLKVAKSETENLSKNKLEPLNKKLLKYNVLTSKPVDFLCKLKIVSKAWKSYLEYDGFWFELLSISDRCSPTSFLALSEDFLRSIPSALDAEEVKYPVLQRVYQELYSLEKIGHFEVNLIRRGIVASSEDHHTQSIAATLSSDPFEFWSSVGVIDVESDETLVYELVSPCCLLRSISLKPFLAQYQKGLPCYAPRSVSFSIGFTKTKFHFTSEKFPMENTSATQKFVLPALVAGCFLCIHLHGRNQNQPGDNLFYTCLESVEAKGVSGPSLTMCPLLLKCCGNYLLGKLEEIESSSPVEEFLATCTDSGLEEHLEDLKNIAECLDLFKEANYAAAIDIMANAPFHSLLRKKEFLENYFLAIFSSKDFDDLVGRNGSFHYPKFAHWYQYYVSILFEKRKMLTGDEALLLAKLSNATDNVRLIDQGINSGLINCKLELGLVFESNNQESLANDSSRKELLSIAYIIYVHGRSFDKILDLSIKLNNLQVVCFTLFHIFNASLITFC